MGLPIQSQGTIGVGIYSFVDAARFIGADARDLRRWLAGYSNRRDGIKHKYEPLWQSQLAGTEIDGIGFRDLIELRFVRLFVSAGVPLTLIRRTVDELRERLGREYPFTSTSFKTDGKRIFMSLLNDNGDEALVDVVKRQDVIPKVIGPSLREGLELNVDDEATRWYPMRRSKAVVLDPERSFGQPVLNDSGVPTIAVTETLKAEGGDITRTARIFEISTAAVRKAVAFEQQILA